MQRPQWPDDKVNAHRIYYIINTKLNKTESISWDIFWLRLHIVTAWFDKFRPAEVATGYCRGWLYWQWSGVIIFKRLQWDHIAATSASHVLKCVFHLWHHIYFVKVFNSLNINERHFTCDLASMKTISHVIQTNMSWSINILIIITWQLSFLELGRIQ